MHKQQQMFDALHIYRSANRLSLKPRFGLICLWPGLVNAAAAQVDQQCAGDYLRETAMTCERDSGWLWGVFLRGPMDKQKQ